MPTTGPYLRTPRLFFFLLTTALCATTVALTSWGLWTGYHQKGLVRQKLAGAELHIADALGSGGAVTAASGIASLSCFAMIALTLFRPHQPETLKTVRIKEGLFAFSALFFLVTLIPATVIMATRGGHITKAGVAQSTIDSIVAISGLNLAYDHQKPIKAYVIVGWFAFLSTVINLVLVSLEARHVLKHGSDGGLVDSHHNAAHRDSESAPSMAEGGLSTNKTHESVFKEGHH